MIKKIKTDDINIDILFNEIAALKSELSETQYLCRERGRELSALRDVYLPSLRRMVQSGIDETRILKAENARLKDLAANTSADYVLLVEKCEKLERENERLVEDLMSALKSNKK